MKHLKRYRLKTALVLLFGLCLGVLISETALRVMGYEPYKFYENDDNDKVYGQYDSEIGWIHKKGHYKFASLDSSLLQTDLTIGKHGERITGKEEINYKNSIIFLGGSYTEGFGLSDSNTFAWRVQSEFSNTKVWNFGVFGYGTYQSLLLLKRVLKKIESTKLVVYYFIGVHDKRNAGQASWMRNLVKRNSREHIELPIVTLDKKNELLVSQKDRYISLPLREHSALVALIEKAYMQLKTRQRMQTKESVTKKLFIELKDFCKKNGCEFVIINLRAKKHEIGKYLQFITDNKINYLDCSMLFKKEYTIPNDGHPDEILNKKYAERISRYLKNNFDFIL